MSAVVFAALCVECSVRAERSGAGVKTTRKPRRRFYYTAATEREALPRFYSERIFGFLVFFTVDAIY